MSRKSRARRGAESALRRLYDSLPRLQCQGKCHDTCGPIAMSEFERIRMAEAAGGTLPVYMPELDVNTGCTCPLLTPEKRCSIYESRPLICRLFGMIRDSQISNMRCHHGCKPDRYLTDTEAARLFRKAEEISQRYYEEEGHDYTNSQ
jgi:uncharacterized protein